MFGLVDCNSFFASCEKVFVPRLRNRPVIVLSNNDGCVIARSMEAKKLGIAMGVPFFQIEQKCQKLGITVFSANFSLYSNMSRRVMNTLRQWCPDVQVYSIDEAFLKLDGVENAETEEFQRQVIETIWKWTGIPVSFGVGPTKTLAKIATHIAKIREIGCFTINDSGQLQELLPQIPVGDVWGIGHRTARVLMARGVRTAWDLYLQNPIQIRHDFSICQERTVRELRGESCLNLEDFAAPKNSIQHSRSFGTTITDVDTLAEPVSTFLETVMERLRRYGKYTNAVWISLYGYTCDASDPHARQPYSEGVTVPLEIGTNDTLTVLPCVLRKLRKTFSSEVFYQKAGVTLMGLSTEPEADKYRMFQSPEEQKTMDQETEKRQKLMNVLDALHQKLGRKSIVFASEGLEKAPEWQSRHKRRSPEYTTSWEELPNAR